MTPKIYTSFDAITNYRNAWSEALNSSNPPTLFFDWFYGFEKFFSPENQIIVTVWESEKKQNLIATLPLSIRNKILGQSSYEIMGSIPLYEPSNFIFRNEKALQELLNTICSLKSPVLFARIPYDISLKHNLPKKQFKNLLVEKEVVGSQYLNLPGTVEDFEHSLSPRRRSDLRRYHKKAKARGNVNFRFLYPDEDGLDSILSQAFKIEHSGWKSKTKTSILSQPATEGFLRHFFSTLCKDGKLLIGFLYIEKEPVAMNIAAISFQKLWMIKIGFNDDFKKITPGILLTHELIKFAITSSLHSVEFLGSSEKWIQMWNPGYHRYKVAILYPLNFSGLLHFLKDGAQVITKKLFK